MKTTRFLNMMAASLVGVAFMSCSSQDDVLTPAGQTYTMSVTAQKGGDGTRALNLDGNKLKATWTAGDEVEVWTEDGTTKKYGTLTAESAGASTKLTGTLTKLPENGASLTLKYLSPSYSQQDGTLTGSANSIDKVCDYATATVTATVSGTNVTTGAAAFQNQQAVVKFTLVDKADGTTKLNPTAFTMTDGTSTVELTNIPAGTYTTNGGDGVLYVAFPASNVSADITLTATVGSDTYTCTTSEAQTLGNGKYYGVTAQMTKQAAAPDGAISGQFTVNSNGDKVYFSKGNLQLSAANTWKFADNQWEYFGDSQSDNHRDLFGWGTGNNPNQTSTNNSNYSSFTDWGTAAASSIGSGWRTLTGGDGGEWEYLFGTNPYYKRTTTSGLYFAKATVNGVPGVILLPDDWSTSYYTLSSTNSTDAAFDTNTISESDWSSKLESHGCVFLPAAGYREGTMVRDVGSFGDYWSSTAKGSDEAYDVYFDSDNVGPAYTYDRYYGFSVRLVKDVAAPAPAVPTTLAELKTWVKAGNTETTYYGYYVNSSGEIHSSYVSGDIGRVAYYQNSDVETAASGRRILVLALVDVDRYRWKNASTSGESDYNSTTAMNGLAFCQSHSDNSTTYPAAYGAYNWDKSRPSGSTNWFLPSRAQWDKMLTVAKRSGTGQINGGYYWSATEVDQPRNAYFYVFSDSYWGYSLKDEKNDVRACFAY